MLLVKDKVAVLIVIPVVTIVGMFCIFNQFKDVIFEPLPTNALAETTPSIVTLVAWIWPLTSSAYKGLILLSPTFPLLNTLIAPINPFAFIEVAMLLVKERFAVLTIIPSVTTIGILLKFIQFKEVIVIPLPTKLFAITVPLTKIAEALTTPTTSSLVEGVFVPAPTLPLVDTLIAPINPMAFIEIAMLLVNAIFAVFNNIPIVTIVGIL